MNASLHHTLIANRRRFAAVWLFLPMAAAAQDAGMTMPMADAPSVQQKMVIASSPVEMQQATSMQDMDMNDSGSHSMLLIDQLEYAHGYDGDGAMWESEAWYGNDSNKLWLRSEGESSQGRVDDGDIEAFWNHPFSAFWNSQLGIRHDFGLGPQRNWAAFGLQGMAPYWLELEATAYASESGRLAARLRAEYTLRFTQRLILQPEFEANLYSRDDVARYVGSGVSNAQLGLRLRYEITRQFAPYLGIVWTRSFGATADFVRVQQQPVFDRQFVAGFRFWF
jgi:copper resistance protein B